MKKIIITADDYGMSESVNEAIIRGVENGIITSTNVMVGMDFFHQSLRLRKAYPNLSIGIHFTLTAGKPVSNVKDIPTLVKPDGYFYNYHEFQKLNASQKIDCKDIQNEIMAQYSKFCDILNEPDYWNTHQNIHLNHKLFHMFLSVTSNLKIHKMRSHERLYVKSNERNLRVRDLFEPFKRIILKKWNREAKKRYMISPDGIIVVRSKEKKYDIDYISDKIVWGNKTIGELVIHPSTNQNCVYFGNISEQRVREFEVYTDPLIKDMLFSKNIVLCGFESLDRINPVPR